MRTTVTLDLDVHRLLKEAERRSGQPFKQVLNDALRAGLKRPPARTPPFKQRVFSLGRPRVDLTKAGALAAELEDLEIIAKGRRDARR
ncbi:MAG: antitoxin [Ideonella sp.]|nr:antitoxin [Ideonella sp.]MCC7456393.1 hypothetical protein [Nitrospira sp.]